MSDESSTDTATQGDSNLVGGDVPLSAYMPDDPFAREAPEPEQGGGESGDDGPPAGQDAAKQDANGDQLKTGDDGQQPRSKEDIERALAALTKRKQKQRAREEQFSQERQEFEEWKASRKRLQERIDSGDIDAILEERTGMDYKTLTKRKLAQAKAPGVLPPEVEEKLSEVDTLKKELEDRKAREAEWQKQQEEQSRAQEVTGVLKEYLSQDTDPLVTALASRDDTFSDTVRSVLEQHTDDDGEWTLTPADVARNLASSFRQQYNAAKEIIDLVEGAAGASQKPDARLGRDPNPETERTGDTSEGSQMQPLRQGQATEARGKSRRDYSDAEYWDMVMRATGNKT